MFSARRSLTSLASRIPSIQTRTRPTFVSANSLVRPFTTSSRLKMPEQLKQSEVDSKTDPSVSKQYDTEASLETKTKDLYAIVDGLKIGILGTYRPGVGVSNQERIPTQTPSNIPNTKIQHPKPNTILTHTTLTSFSPLRSPSAAPWPSQNAAARTSSSSPTPTARNSTTSSPAPAKQTSRSKIPATKTGSP